MSKPLFTDAEWTFDKIKETWEVIDDIARNDYGLDYPRPQMEMVTYEQMLDNYSSTGMPSMYNHWSFGKRFIQDHDNYVKGRQGLAYEMIINTDPAVCYLMENNSMTMQALVMAHANCVDKDTEVLTPEGWVKVSEYAGQDIAQLTTVGDKEYAMFLKPLKYIVNDQESFLHIKARGVDQMVTEDHDLVYRTPEGKLKKQTAKSFAQQHYNKTRGHNGKFLTGFKLCTKPLSQDTDLIRLMVAIKADGSRHGRRYRFHLKKKRKINRLERLLRNLFIEYSKGVGLDGATNITFEFAEIPKEFEWRSLRLMEENRVISEEVLHWDGNLEQQTFSTTIKQSAEVIQAIWASNGFGTNINVSRSDGKKPVYQVKRSKYSERSISRSRGGVKNEILTVPSVDGKSYCFTTSTGMWISRRNGCIAVTGNCGHGSFFKMNYLFQEWTQPDAILDYLAFAKQYIADCEYKYGEKEVELTLDAAHALKYNGIDSYKRGYKKPQKELKRRKKEWMKHLHESLDPNWDLDEIKKKINDIDDIIYRLGQDRRTFPEENILYFLEKYSPVLETWQKEILRIVRKISQYFYPQMQTKLMNEGWASFIHYTLMGELNERGYITDGSYIEFLESHTGVCCQPGYKRMAGFNPYALGFEMFRDIRRVCEDPTEEDRYWFPEFAGEKDWLAVCKEAVELYRDESFILKYLSPKVIRDFKMFTVYDDQESSHYRIDEVHGEEDVLKLREKLSKQYDITEQLPKIEVTGVDWDDTRALELTFTSKDGKLVDSYDAGLVDEYLRYLWGYDSVWDIVGYDDDED